MAAPKDNQNAAGPHAMAPLNNRVKLATLRGLIVDECISILQKNKHDLSEKEYEFRQDIILKLAPTVLPRLQEHSGVDGERLQLFFDSAFNNIKLEEKADDSTPRDTKEDSSEPKEV